MSKTKTYTGKIDSKLELLTSQAGKSYTSFVLKTEKALIPCVAFEGLAELIVGTYKNEQVCSIVGNQKSPDEEVFVKHFRTEEIETDRIIRWYGSKEKYLEYHRSLEKEFRRRGYVKVREQGEVFYSKESRCVSIADEHQLKINYVMDLLGAEYVTGEVRRHLGAESPKEIIGKTTVKGFKERYEMLLEHLVLLARQKEAYAGEYR